MRTMWVPTLNPDKPKYRALFDGIVQAVKHGDLVENEKLPPIRELAYQLKITPATVVRAYQMAIDQDLLEARRGDGTYVKPKSSGLTLQDYSTLKAVAADEGGYNLFSRSIPDLGQNELINKIIAQILRDGGFSAIEYVPKTARPTLKERVQSWLKSDDILVSPDEFVITQGASNATAVALEVMRAGGGRLTGATETLTYTGFQEKSLGGICRYLALDMDEEGVLPEALERVAREEDIDFYVTSSIIQNPCSVILSNERMVEIAKIARRYDFQIVDDILHSHLLNVRPNSLRDYAPERVWTVTSLAKLGYPALNLGVLIPPIERVREAELMLDAMDIRTNQLQYPIISMLLGSSEFYELVKKTRSEIEARRNIVKEALSGFDYSLAEGAPFLWLRVPSHLPLSRFINALKARGVFGVSSDVFSMSEASPNALRLTFGGTLTREQFAEGVAQVRSALEDDHYDRVV